MTERNKEILLKGNAAITAGNYEAFLDLCTEDTRWEFVGERILSGKDAIREYMAEFYIEPPKFDVIQFIEEGNFLSVIGEIHLKEGANWVEYFYCDVWRFENGLMAELHGYVIKKQK